MDFFPMCVVVCSNWGLENPQPLHLCYIQGMEEREMVEGKLQHI